MAYTIQTIEGIGAAMGKKLAKANIQTVEKLLDQCCTPKGRKSIAAETGIDKSQLLKWTNMADLMRITGIAGQYGERLKASGVDTVKELRNWKAANLAVKMEEVNAKKKLTRMVPSEKMVSNWVDAAKKLKPAISY